ncbi:MAG: flagellar protein FlaG [Alphaproteobacteria bacterium]
MNVNPVAPVPQTVTPVVLRSASTAGPDRVEATREEAAKVPKVTTAKPAARSAPNGPTHFRVSLDIDHDINRVIATITHPETGEVIGQFPPEQIRNIAKAIRDMLAPVVDETV